MLFIKNINLLIAFLLELCLIFSLGYYGFHSSANKVLNIIIGIGLPAIAIVLWGLFAAPRSAYRLQPTYRLAFELALYFTAAYLLYKTGKQSWAIVLAVAAIVSELVAYVLKQ